MEANNHFIEFKDRVKRNCSTLDDEPQYKKWIDSIKSTLGSLKGNSWKLSIYRVPKKFRKLKEDAYTPSMVSIGPFHHRRDELRDMEEQKWRYMLSLMHRTTGAVDALNECASAINHLEANFRRYYSEVINFNSHELAKILLVDGCFILELFIRYSEKKFGDERDPVFNSVWGVQTLQRDLALLENQIPFVVLQILLDIVKKSASKPLPHSLTRYALTFFQSALDLSDQGVESKSSSNLTAGKHLLDMLHNAYLPTSTHEESTKKDLQIRKLKGATEFVEEGVTFEVSKSDDLLDIRFNEGQLTIRPLRISETIFRNLIAFEQFSFNRSNHIASYALLMESLIGSPQDCIELKQKKVVISCESNAHENVSTFFKSLCKEVVYRDFYFSDLCKKVNNYRRPGYCWRKFKTSLKVRWPGYVIALRDDYFRNPWKIMGLIAALVVLAFTAIQTYYTVRSYYPH